MDNTKTYKQKVISQLKEAIENTQYRLLLQRARLSSLHEGHMRYIGSPCRNGHIGIRYTISDCCVECAPHYRQEKKKNV